MIAAITCRNALLLVTALLAGVIAGCAGRMPNAPPPPSRYDLVIRNGRIIDGSGSAAFVADLAVNDGRIAHIGAIPAGRGDAEIDASGLVVAPGFIDVHTHVDADIHRFPLAENFIRDGVTTIVSGNCGYSVRDVGEHFQRISESGAAVNVATLIGHNTILRAARGDGAAELTPAQMEQAKAMVRQAMLDGAVGMSTGLIYLPGTYSSTDEIIELQKVAAQYRGIYATHMRSEASQILSAIDEALRIGREADCRVQISHFKLPADVARAIGGSDTTLRKIIEARRAGQEVWLDQYPYTASSTTIATLLPDELLKDGVAAARQRLTDAAEVERTIEAMRQKHEIGRQRTHMAFAVIASSSAFPQYAGHNIRQIAQFLKLRAQGGGDVELLGMSAGRLPEVTMEDQYRAIVHIFAGGDASCVFHSMAEPEVENIMRSPLVAIASDSGIRQFNVGVPHPRGYGTNARVLGRYVRERRILTLEEAVRKMTSLPALLFRFTDRGLLRGGYAADITLFDPDRIIDRATFEQPHQYPEGIRCVIVNGEVVLQDGVLTGKLPGRPLRSNQPAALSRP